MYLWRQADSRWALSEISFGFGSRFLHLDHGDNIHAAVNLSNLLGMPGGSSIPRMVYSHAGRHCQHDYTPWAIKNDWPIFKILPLAHFADSLQ